MDGAEDGLDCDGSLGLANQFTHQKAGLMNLTATANKRTACSPFVSATAFSPAFVSLMSTSPLNARRNTNLSSSQFSASSCPASPITCLIHSSSLSPSATALPFPSLATESTSRNLLGSGAGERVAARVALMVWKADWDGRRVRLVGVMVKLWTG